VYKTPGSNEVASLSFYSDVDGNGIPDPLDRSDASAIWFNPIRDEITVGNIVISNNNPYFPYLMTRAEETPEKMIADGEQDATASLL